MLLFEGLVVGILVILSLMVEVGACLIVSTLWIDADTESTDWLESGHYLKLFG